MISTTGKAQTGGASCTGAACLAVALLGGAHAGATAPPATAPPATAPPTAEATPLQASLPAGGRFVVIGCSLPRHDKGERFAHLRVRAMRAAGFSRAHVLDGDRMPALGSFWICAIDTFADEKQAVALAERATKVGFKAYVARGW